LLLAQAILNGSMLTGHIAHFSDFLYLAIRSIVFVAKDIVPLGIDATDNIAQKKIIQKK